MRRIAEQRPDPTRGAVVRGDVVLEQELAEQHAATNVRERSEREQAVGRLDEPRDVVVLAFDLLDDRADRLVDERNPEILDVGHHLNYCPDPCLARQAICAAVTSRYPANSFRSVASGRLSATWAPPIAAPIDARPITTAGRRRTFP